MNESEGGFMEEKLFGAVARPTAEGDHSVPAEQLVQALPHEEYATRFFCAGCGTVLPVLREAIPRIIGTGQEPEPTQYIHTERCDVCGAGFQNARVEDIPTS